MNNFPTKVGRVSLIRCGPASDVEIAFEVLLRLSFGEDVELQHQTTDCCRSDEGIASIWQTVASFNPRLVFVLGCSGLFSQVLRVLRAGRSLTLSPIVVAIDQAEPESIWRCLELGANDFLAQPWRPLDILPRAWRLMGESSLGPATPSEVGSGNGLGEFVGTCTSFRSEVDKAALVSRFDVGVLIQGESGTGKEMVAQAIHRLSPRAKKPFVAVNSGALPAELIENELFGHERGAFTGAVATQAGLVEQANGGCLFLDEIGCLPLQAQVKLLRFLQSHEFRPLGAGKARSSDVRIIAATNTDMERALRDGNFRADLFYRLNVIPIVLPPLRERCEDIPLLANFFARKYASVFSKTVVWIAPDAMFKITNYHWPGNVRELENTIQRAVVLACKTHLVASDIVLPRMVRAIPESFQQRKEMMIAQFEKTHVEELLAAHQGNISQAAIAGRKNRRAFWQLIRKHKIDVSRFKASVGQISDPVGPICPS